jgi:hypothetical protein
MFQPRFTHTSSKNRHSSFNSFNTTALFLPRSRSRCSYSFGRSNGRLYRLRASERGDGEKEDEEEADETFTFHGASPVLPQIRDCERAFSAALPQSGRVRFSGSTGMKVLNSHRRWISCRNIFPHPISLPINQSKLLLGHSAFPKRTHRSRRTSFPDSPR